MSNLQKEGSMNMNWDEITRDERFFVAYLYHDICRNKIPFERELCKCLDLPDIIKVSSQSYEFCYFRDMAFNGLIERIDEERKSFEKQTFDLMVTLSDKTLVIIEAKAQQGYKTDQLSKLRYSKDIINKHLPSLGLKKVLLVPLYSSLYKPSSITLQNFDTVSGLLWENIAKCYPENKSIYLRANKIYKEKRA